MTRRLGTSIMLASLLAACAGPGSSPASNSPAASEGRSSGDLPESMLESVIQLAADETGVPTDEIEVLVAESVTWSDGSLGCPQPGQMYTQALVPGYRVVLRAAGEELAYHASEAGDFRPCANPIDPAEGGAADR